MKIIMILFHLIIPSMVAFGDSLGKKAEKYFLYVGTYTEGDNEGINVFKFDTSDGDLDYITTVKNVKNPSYLAVHEKKNLLIAVNEIGQYGGEKTGSVSSFQINPSTGNLTMLNQVASGGGAPCYVSLNRTGDLAFVSNYSGGNISVFQINSGGSLKEMSDLKEHEGKGANEKRQNAPHAHSVTLDPKENHALAVDLGIDKVISYAVDYKHGKLNEKNSFSLAPGSGPRHIAFHPNKKFVFVINELNSTITSCAYNSTDGSMVEIETITTLPDDFTGESYCADVHVAPDGNFLYGSNRGHNSIAIFSIDEKTGNISTVGHQSVKGEWPRNFMIDPTGQFLLVANQHTNNIVVFKVDKESGLLKSNGVEVKVSKPVCLKMMPII